MGLRLSLGECRRSLLCVHIALISSLRAAAGGVLLLGGGCLVASSGVPPLGPPGGGEVLLVPNSGLEGDDVLVSVRFFLVDILHALEGSEILGTVELEAHGEDGTSVVPSAVDTLVLDAGVQFLPVPVAYALPVSLCDGVAALKGDDLCHDDGHEHGLSNLFADLLGVIVAGGPDGVDGPGGLGVVDHSFHFQYREVGDEVNSCFVDFSVSFPHIEEPLSDFVHLGVGILVLWGNTLAEVHSLVLLNVLESCLQLEASVDEVLGVVGDDHGGGLLGVGLMGSPSKEVNSESAVLKDMEKYKRVYFSLSTLASR